MVDRQLASIRDILGQKIRQCLVNLYWSPPPPKTKFFLKIFFSGTIIDISVLLLKKQLDKMWDHPSLHFSFLWEVTRVLWGSWTHRVFIRLKTGSSTDLACRITGSLKSRYVNILCNIRSQFNETVRIFY